MSKSKFNWKSTVTWGLILLYFISLIVFIGDPKTATGILELTGVILLLLHGQQRYGWRGILMFVLIAFSVSTLLEDLSIRTGIPFGHYYYHLVGAPIPVPYIDQVPIFVGPIYIAVGYLSWTLGSLILDHADLHLDQKWNVVLMPLISAFIMVQFDLVQDPVTATYQKMWIWQNGGGFNGVPLVNFLGWYLTCFTFMLIFSIWLSKHPATVKRTPVLTSKSFWLQPIVLYGLIGLSYVTGYLYNLTNRTAVTDPTGHAWLVNNIYETAVTVMLFTMLYSIVLALVHLFKRPQTR